MTLYLGLTADDIKAKVSGLTFGGPHSQPGPCWSPPPSPSCGQWADFFLSTHLNTTYRATQFWTDEVHHPVPQA